MRRVVLFALLFAALSLSAQNLTEKIDVNLVNVDVTVTSRGNPARGLTKDDFEILEDGVPQTITNFYAVEGAPVAAVSAPGVAPQEAAAVSEQLRRKVMIVVDARHISVHGRDDALRRLEQFIADHFSSGTYDWSIAMITNRAQLLLPLTSDKAQIHAALRQVREAMANGSMRKLYDMEDRIIRLAQGAESGGAGAPGVTKQLVSDKIIGRTSEDSITAFFESARRFQDASDLAITYSAIRDLTRSFANTPGRKIILLLTSSFNDEESAISAIDGTEAARHTERMTSLRQWVIREANASGSSLYLLDTEGLRTMNIGADNTASDAAGHALAPLMQMPKVVGGTLYWAAHDTGGQIFTGNFIERSLRDFDNSSAYFYSLAFRPQHAEDGRYHSISVRVKKPGRYSLTYRKGYAGVTVEQQLKRALTSPMAAEMMTSATMPLTLAAGAPTQEPSGALLIPIHAAVPAKELQFIPAQKGMVARIDYYVSVFDDRGRVVTTFNTVREAHVDTGSEDEGNFVESHALRLKKGTPYRIVVAMHDQLSDNVGIAAKTVSF